MKQILLFTLLFTTALVTKAQTPKIISIFNSFPEEARNHIEINKMNGKWMGHSRETDQDFAVKLNTKATYLEIKDPGTGGGVTTFQLKMMKDNAGTEFIAINRSWTDGVLFEGGVNFMNAEGEDVSLSYWPDYEESLNFKEGESKEGYEEYFTEEYGYCNIPEAGNTIEIMPGYKAITGGCFNNDAKACALKEKLVPKIVFVWSADHNMFMPK